FLFGFYPLVRPEGVGKQFRACNQAGAFSARDILVGSLGLAVKHFRNVAELADPLQRFCVAAPDEDPHLEIAGGPLKCLYMLAWHVFEDFSIRLKRWAGN